MNAPVRVAASRQTCQCCGGVSIWIPLRLHVQNAPEGGRTDALASWRPPCGTCATGVASLRTTRTMVASPGMAPTRDMSMAPECTTFRTASRSSITFCTRMAAAMPTPAAPPVRTIPGRLHTSDVSPLCSFSEPLDRPRDHDEHRTEHDACRPCPADGKARDNP